MRNFIVAAVLTVAGLGMLGERTEAKAQYPWGYGTTYRYGNAYARQFTTYPQYRWSITPYAYAQMYATPGYARYYRTPYNVGALVRSQAITSYYFSPYFGTSVYYTSPGAAGWGYSPINGYRQYYIPPVTYANTPYYSGYVPAGYVLP